MTDNHGIEARVERLTDALQNIKDWAAAYPVAVFREPDMARASALLKVGGITLDAVAASIMRQTLRHVGQIAAEALAETVDG